MTNEELGKHVMSLFGLSEQSSKNALAAETRLQALTTLVIGVLRAVSQEPRVAAVVAEQISIAADKAYERNLADPVSDEFLQQRDAALLTMIPTPMRPLVKLPTQP